MKKALKVILSIILAVAVIAGIYVAYAMLSYYRIADNQILDVDNPTGVSRDYVPAGHKYSLTSWNIGFAAYLQDYTFFMDGGKESRARSKEAVLDSMEHITDVLEKENSDFNFIQEVDFDATRSYKVDERQIIRDRFKDESYVFAQNYDSPYLFYPFTSPHGKNKAGLVTLSKYEIRDAMRRSLPIQTDVAKFLDLDRCFSLSRVVTSDRHSLVLINFHLSAYTTDTTIVFSQLNMLYKIMQEEYRRGNYVICGGDFNMDLLGDSASVFGVSGGRNASWCQPFPVDEMPPHIMLVAPYDRKDPYPSCRNNDMPYTPGKSFTCTVDGFLVTDNVKVNEVEVLRQDFMYSDHNPIHLEFELKQ